MVRDVIGGRSEYSVGNDVTISAPPDFVSPILFLLVGLVFWAMWRSSRDKGW